MKRFQLLESWHNGCDNAVDELFCESDRRDNIKETLNALTSSIKSDGLGPDFPSGVPKVAYGTDEVRFYLGDDPVTPEFFRSFRIVEVGRKWDFVYDEGVPDTAGRNFFGVLSDGNRFLFFHAFADDEGELEKCHIHDSVLMEPESEVCSYPWTAENDSILLEALNGLENPADFCGEESPLRTLRFKDCEQ